MENKIEISEKLLSEMIEYIEITEETIEDEWGTGKRLEKIIADNQMPDLYNELISLRK